MMKGMIQEFISNEIMDHIDEWEKTAWWVAKSGNEQVNWDCCIDMPEIYGGGGLDFTFNALLMKR
jgi:acyl-CoA dehydrogenase